VRRVLVPVTLVTLALVAIQLDIFSSLRFAGVVVMLVWLWPFCVGLTGWTSLALWTAVIAGVFFDTHSSTPFGLSVVVALALAWFASRLGREGIGDLDSAAWWVTPVLAGVAGFAAPVLFVGAGFFAFDFSMWRNGLAPAMAVNALAFFVLARPTVRLARWLSGLGGAKR
jgi:hypothetical protein